MRPLTIAQKNAIVSKIKNKIAEAETKRYEDFKKNYKFTKDEKECIAAAKAFNAAYKTLKDVNEKLNKWNVARYVSVSSFGEGSIEETLINRAYNMTETPKYPNATDVTNDLEIMSIDPAFDAQAFIDKYTQF